MDGQSDTRKSAIIAAMYGFANQRGGIDPRNYSDWKSYRAEQRSVTKDLHDARVLLRALELSSVGADALAAAFKSAFCGRLTLADISARYDDGSVYTRYSLSYCTGQYFPTEYRKAICAVASSALWHHYRDDYAASAKDGESAGDAIRRNFRRQYGAQFAKRWFD